MNRIYLYDLLAHRKEELRIGKKMNVQENVIIWALDDTGNYFLEKTDPDVVVTCDNRAVIEIFQGRPGELIAINDRSYFILNQNQVAVNPETVADPKLNEFFSKLENDFSQKVEVESQKFQRKIEKLKQIKVIKLRPAITVSLFLTIVAVSLFFIFKNANETQGAISPGLKKISVVKSTTEKPMVAEVSSHPLVEKETSESMNRDAKDPEVSVLQKTRLNPKKTNATKITALRLANWETIGLKYEALAANGDLESLNEIDVIRLEGLKFHDDWKNFEKRKTLMEAFANGGSILVDKLKLSDISTLEKMEASKFLISHFKVFPKSLRLKINNYVKNLEKNFASVMVEAEYDPASSKMDLKKIQSLLPADHWLFDKIEKSIERL